MILGLLLVTAVTEVVMFVTAAIVELNQAIKVTLEVEITKIIGKSGRQL